MAEPAIDVNNLTPSNEGGGITMDQAVSALQGVTQQSEVADVVEDELETVEDDTSEIQDLETDEDYEEPEEEVDEDDSEGDEQDEASDTGFEIDGDFYTETQLLEFKESGLRQADYTKKTQEVAELKQQAAQQLEQQAQVVQQQVQALEQYGHLIAATMEMDGMTDENLQRIKDEQGWEAYAEFKETAENRRAQLQGTFRALQEAQQQQAAQAEAMQTQRMAEATQVIAEKIPDYMDQTKGPEIRKGVQEMLVGYGISPEILGTIDVPGLFIAAHDLWEMKNKSPSSVKQRLSKKKATPKVSPVNRGGQAQSRKARVSKATSDSVNRATQSGNVDDAAAAMAALLKPT